VVSLPAAKKRIVFFERRFWEGMKRTTTIRRRRLETGVHKAPIMEQPTAVMELSVSMIYRQRSG